MLAVQNTSVNGGEITPDDAERVSVENVMVFPTLSRKSSDVDAVQASVAKDAIEGHEWPTSIRRGTMQQMSVMPPCCKAPTVVPIVA